MVEPGARLQSNGGFVAHLDLPIGPEDDLDTFSRRTDTRMTRGMLSLLLTGRSIQTRDSTLVKLLLTFPTQYLSVGSENVQFARVLSAASAHPTDETDYRSFGRHLVYGFVEFDLYRATRFQPIDGTGLSSLGCYHLTHRRQELSGLVVASAGLYFAKNPKRLFPENNDGIVYRLRYAETLESESDSISIPDYGIPHADAFHISRGIDDLLTSGLFTCRALSARKESDLIRGLRRIHRPMDQADLEWGMDPKNRRWMYDLMCHATILASRIAPP